MGFLWYLFNITRRQRVVTQQQWVLDHSMIRSKRKFEGLRFNRESCGFSFYLCFQTGFGSSFRAYVISWNQKPPRDKQLWWLSITARRLTKRLDSWWENGFPQLGWQWIFFWSSWAVSFGSLRSSLLRLFALTVSRSSSRNPCWTVPLEKRRYRQTFSKSIFSCCITDSSGWRWTSEKRSIGWPSNVVRIRKSNSSLTTALLHHSPRGCRATQQFLFSFPLNHFNTGNQGGLFIFRILYSDTLYSMPDTLERIPQEMGIDIFSYLRKFHETYYCGLNIGVVTLSPLPLNDQKSLVESHFGK